MDGQIQDLIGIMLIRVKALYICSWSINYPWKESRFSRVAIDTIWYSLPPNEKEMVIPIYKHNGR
ncbi:MAG: hypothetical protein QXO37_09765 [Candidatus Nitrosocaldaceae archaeon]